MLILLTVTELGNIGCQDGPIMAAADQFKINVRGKGGHGANPQGTVDAIVTAAAVVTALQTVVSRNQVSIVLLHHLIHRLCFTSILCL